MGGGVGAEEHAEGFGELGLPTAFSGKGESATRDSWQSPEVLRTQSLSEMLAVQAEERIHLPNKVG